MLTKPGIHLLKRVSKIGMLVAGIALPLTTSASVLFRIDAERLKDSNGNAIPFGQGLALLVASTTDENFDGPEPGNFTTADDVVLRSWNMNVPGDDGVLFLDDESFELSGDWGEGDLLGLYWYPDRTSEAGGPTAGESFGFYTDQSGIDGGDAWITPADGAPEVDLFFLTSDATFAGSNLPSAGEADLTVVPEPSTYALIAGMSLLGFAGYRRFKMKVA